MISCLQNCQKHDSVLSEQRILLVQKYHTRKDLVASLISMNKALILDPLASNEQKKTRNDQLSVFRKLAKTAAADYLQFLVRFQYGEEAWDVLPDTQTFSLVPPELKKKLESLQKATKKAKADVAEREMKQDNSYKYRDSYGTGSNRFRASKRYSPYPGGFNNYNQQSPNYGFSDHHNVQGAYLPQAAPPGWAMPGQPSTPTYNINPSGGPYSTGTPNPGRGFNPYGIFFLQTDQPTRSNRQHGTKVLFIPPKHARIPETFRNVRKPASADDAINLVIGTGTTCVIRWMWLVN